MTPVTKLWRVSKLAEKHGIPKQTLHDYVQSGRLAQGTPSLSIANALSPKAD